MSFFIENRTYGYADINLYDGSRRTLGKGESFSLGHEPTESERRYYSKMNCIGIYLVENKESYLSDVTDDIECLEDSFEVYEGNEEGSKAEPTDYSKVSFNDLMKFRHAELVEIARSLGHTDFSEDFSKKEIVRLIRGG